MAGYERKIPTTFALTVVGGTTGGAFDVTAPVGAKLVIMGADIVTIGDASAKTETRHLFGVQADGTVPSSATLVGIDPTIGRVFAIFELAGA